MPPAPPPMAPKKPLVPVEFTARARPRPAALLMVEKKDTSPLVAATVVVLWSTTASWN